jgi:predicted DNA-binding mobile mystery protein A
MSIKDAVRQQYVRIMNRASQQLDAIHKPAEGWLVTMRKALGMSGSEVAARAGVSRNAIYQAERNEREGAITIKQMQGLAKAMGGQFVYAIIAEGSVDDIILAQATRTAEARVRRASAHMALEQQSLTESQIRQRVEALTRELVRDMPPNFWKDK